MKKLIIITTAFLILVGCNKEEAELELTKLEYESVAELVENVEPYTKEDLNNIIYTVLEDDLLEEIIEVGYNQDYPQGLTNNFTYVIRYLAENELYCDELYLMSYVSECEIDDYALASMRRYYEVYSKTEKFPAGVVVKKQGDNYEIVAAYPTARTDVIQATANDITIILNSAEGSDEYNQAVNRLQETYEKNGGTGYVVEGMIMSDLLASKAQIEEISQMTPQEIVENYDEYLMALKEIKYVVRG